MRFPHPVSVICRTCGQPTVIAETALGSVRVHCGTWRWKCDMAGAGTERGERRAVRPAVLAALDAVSDHKMAA
jgi:hypothetical protein